MTNSQFARLETPKFACEVRGATTAEKLRGTKVWVPTLGLAGCWVREEVAPSHCEGPGYHPGKFLKIQILNLAFW